MDIFDRASLLNAARQTEKPVAFLVGAPLSMRAGGGVPGVQGMLDIAREVVKSRGAGLIAQFEQAVFDKSGGEGYQVGMRWLNANLNQAAVNEVVKLAVLRARRPGAPDPFDQDGEAVDWDLPDGILQLAQLVRGDAERFSGPILTTNFDPLISVALRSLGARVRRRIIDSDGALAREAEIERGEIEVVHLHGFWRGSDTLHTAAQLTSPRPKLKASLQALLRRHSLIVVAYGGWDDVFATALHELLNDDEADLDVLWAFHESDAHQIGGRYGDLLDRVGTAITRGRFRGYRGIDCHRIFAEIADSAPTPTAAVASPPPTSLLEGWTLVNRGYLDGQSALTAGEVLRYFDGAVPTWRHAVSDAIPRRHRVAEVVGDLEKARNADAGCSLQLIRAAGGEGKTTLLLQAAADAVRSGPWNVLWRSSPNLELKPNELTGLATGQSWLIVADDAENLVSALDRAATLLSEAGRTNVHFLLAARDVNWIEAQGNTTILASRLVCQPDLLLRGINKKDAKAIVTAWESLGNDGLRQLANVKKSSQRIDWLFKATRSEERSGADEGSLFGALLRVRFSEAGLRAHLADVMTGLKTMRIDGSPHTLLDALIPVAACHGIGIPGIDERVLADLLRVPRGEIHTRVVNRLGAESTAVRSAGHILTRHTDVAKAILVVADQSPEIDLGEVWAQLIEQTAATSRTGGVSHRSHPGIVHAGPKLQDALPELLSLERRKAIAIAAARAETEFLSERLDCVVDLAKTLRIASEPEAAAGVFRDHLAAAQQKIDYTEVIRGYWFEWSVDVGECGGNRQFSLGAAWLAGLSISDHLNPTLITQQNIKMACAGLGVAFGKLAGRKTDSPYALARRAVAWLGDCTNPDAKAASYFRNHHRDADALGTPNPTDQGQAIAWLQAAVAAAGRELQDPFLKALSEPEGVGFQQLGVVLKSSC